MRTVKSQLAAVTAAMVLVGAGCAIDGTASEGAAGAAEEDPGAFVPPGNTWCAEFCAGSPQSCSPQLWPRSRYFPMPYPKQLGEGYDTTWQCWSDGPWSSIAAWDENRTDGDGRPLLIPQAVFDGQEGFADVRDPVVLGYPVIDFGGNSEGKLRLWFRKGTALQGMDNVLPRLFVRVGNGEENEAPSLEGGKLDTETRCHSVNAVEIDDPYADGTGAKAVRLEPDAWCWAEYDMELVDPSIVPPGSIVTFAIRTRAHWEPPLVARVIRDVDTDRFRLLAQ